MWLINRKYYLSITKIWLALKYVRLGYYLSLGIIMKFKFSLVAVLFLTINSAFAKKVLVVISGYDDGNPTLRKTFETRSNKNITTYSKLGYEVIHIDGNQPSSALKFIDEVSRLNNVDELHVSINSHGIINNAESKTVSSDDISKALERFPISHIRKDELETQGDDIRSFMKYSTGESVRFSYMIGSPKIDSDPLKRNLGLGDLYNVLSKLKSENPNMITTLEALSCYGGNSSRALESIPDIQTFSAASSDRSALAYDLRQTSPEYQDYIMYFQDNLMSGQTYLDAHLNAKEKDLKAKIYESDNSGGSEWLVMPQNNLELFFADMCLGAPVKTEVNINKCFQENKEYSLDSISNSMMRIQTFSYMTKSLDLEDEFIKDFDVSLHCQDLKPKITTELLNSARDELVSEYKKIISPEYLDSLEKDLDKFKEAKSFSEVKKLNLIEITKTVGTNEHLEKMDDVFSFIHQGNISDFSERFKNLKDSTIGIKKHVTNLSQMDFSKCEKEVCDYEAIMESFVYRKKIFFSKELLLPRVSLLLPFPTGSEFNSSRLDTNRNDPVNKILEKYCPINIDRRSTHPRVCIEKMKNEKGLESFYAHASFYNKKSEPNVTCSNVNDLKVRNKKLRKCLSEMDKRADPEFWKKNYNLLKLGSRKIISK